MKLSKRIAIICVLTFVCLTMHNLARLIDTYNVSFYTNNGKCFLSASGRHYDPHQIENFGTPTIFAEDGLEPIADNITSDSFDKSQIVVVQTQSGVPICAYSGDSVYCDTAENLPNTTKVMVDGKALYVHCANFQIIDNALLK